MSVIAVAVLCALVIVLVVMAAPQARTGCPGGQHVAVTGRARVVIGGKAVTVPVYGCEPLWATAERRTRSARPQS